MAGSYFSLKRRGKGFLLHTILFILFLIALFILIDGLRVYLSHVFYKEMTRTPFFPPVVYFICLVLIYFFTLALYIENRKKTNRLIEVQKAIIFALASLAEWRDPETGHHLARTRDYAILIAKGYQKIYKDAYPVNESFIEDLYYAAPLHDIGKVGIPDTILLKPERLTEEEFDVMKNHVVIGKHILERVINEFKLKERFLFMAKNIAAYHHERYDGKGYVEGLKGEEIPLEARIFAVCDVYDALRTERPYKKAFSHEEAVKMIMSESGGQFDPRVVRVFMDHSEEVLKLFERDLSSKKELVGAYGFEEKDPKIGEVVHVSEPAQS